MRDKQQTTAFAHCSSPQTAPSRRCSRTFPAASALGLTQPPCPLGLRPPQDSQARGGDPGAAAAAGMAPVQQGLVPAQEQCSQQLQAPAAAASHMACLAFQSRVGRQHALQGSLLEPGQSAQGVGPAAAAAAVGGRGLGLRLAVAAGGRGSLLGEVALQENRSGRVCR
jgi:hypothetical protein